MGDRVAPRYGLPRGGPATPSHRPRDRLASSRRPVRMPETACPAGSRAITATSSPEKPDGFTRARIRLRPGSHLNKTWEKVVKEASDG